jgi:ABC-2 type transport system ATP-binding protein
LFETSTAFEFVRLAARLQSLPDPAAAARAALRHVDLDDDADRRVGTFSRGMRQRVKIAQAIVHDPEVLVLDEPLTGLDPRQRVHLIELFQSLGASGRAVVVSSHVLDEVERFGSRVLVLAQGRLAAEGDFHAIRELMDDRPHRIRIRSDRPRALASRLLNGDGVVAVRLEADGSVIVDTVDATRFRRAVAVGAAEVQAHLYEVAPLDDDLESVFRYLVTP